MASSHRLVDGDFARKLPKIELHAHLSGSISRKCLGQLWEQKKAADPGVALEDPLEALPLEKTGHNLQTGFAVFSCIYKLCNDLPSIKFSTWSVLQDFAADGVVYLELRTTPRAIPDTDISKELYTTTILDVIAKYNLQHGSQMQTNLILSIDRRNTLVQAEEALDLAIKYRSRGIVGIDLCGDPAKGDPRIFTPVFRRAKAMGFALTIHFAESPSSSTDDELLTILSWQPDRLGHLVHVNDEIRKLIVDKQIGVELCLSSNVLLKMIHSYSDHHFRWWKDSGTRLALCTDDVSIFDSPLSNEHLLAAQHFGLSRTELLELCSGAFGMIFGDEQAKSRLRRIYQDWQYIGGDDSRSQVE